MPSAMLIALAVAALILAMWSARKRSVFVAAGLAAIFLMSVCLAFWQPTPHLHAKVLEVTSIDVGEGDSTLLCYARGSHFAD